MDNTVKLISIFIAIGFISLFIFLIVTNQVSTTGSSLRCQSGYCPTSLITGEKRCPPDDLARYKFDPTIEVCNPPSYCTHEKTPYTVTIDGYTKDVSACDYGYICPCSRSVICPKDTATYFKYFNSAVNDSYYITQTAGNGKQITGNYTSVITQDGTINEVPQVLSYKILCNVPSYQLSKLNPQVCSGLDLTRFDNLKTCILRNPCLQGKMVYMADLDNVACKNLDFICPSGSIIVQHSTSGQLFCE